MAANRPAPSVVTRPNQRASAPRKGGAGRRCVWCGSQLPVNSRAITCSASCRSQLSRKKRQQADAACVLAFGWTKGEGEALVKQYGLPSMERVLNMRGVVWFPTLKTWVFEEHAAKAAA